ncbi:MAG: CPBP family intramembrane metalloprotease [Methanothrix sp.]|nr:CPBP family intramembrane metalloprotease [Methanothrix sp.]
MRLELSRRYNLDLVVPVGLIVLAELLIFIGNMKVAMIIHAVNLIFIILSTIYVDNRIYPILMLLPLFRLINVAMPVFFQLTLYSYSLVYAPMIIPIYFLMKDGLLSRSEAGITFKGFWFYLPLALAVGILLGWGEHNVLQSGAIVPDSSIKSILILSITMIVFVGFVEEFIFRSALQTLMSDRLGSILGLLITSVIFGFMHSGYHLPLELLYVTFAGLVFGLFFWMTNSLPLIAFAHGITNVSLFMIAPAYPEMSAYLIGIPGIILIIYAVYIRKKGEPIYMMLKDRYFVFKR